MTVTYIRPFADDINISTGDTDELLALDEAPHQLQVINSTGYAYYGPHMGPELQGKPNQRPRLKLEVTFITDMAPGPWRSHADLMIWIAANPYVDTVTLIDPKGNKS